VDIGEIVGAMSSMLRRLIGEDVLLTVLARDGLGRALVDPSQIEQVVMNLAVNARDAMPTGGKLNIGASNVSVDEHHLGKPEGVASGPFVMLAVTDTGVGMTEEVRTHVFEPFFTTKEKGKGTGLGLSTVFGIIQQSGGTIWVDTKPGVGTSFKAYLPTVAADADVVEVSRQLPIQRGTETILLCEDDEAVRALARAILTRNGYRVLEAKNGGEALMLSERNAIDLLVTDVVMPMMSGRQLAERLRAIRPGLKVLYMSGYTDDAVVRHGVLKDELEFLQKPLTPDALARKVREVLDAVAR
jgi:CheY-like chemotaxis protein